MFDNYENRLDIIESLIEKHMPLENWGFSKNLKGFSGNLPDIFWGTIDPVFATVIYNSENCRVKFLLTNEDHFDVLKVYYGRLHAPNTERIIHWNKEKYYCWCWDIWLLLKFLDGYSAQEAVEKKQGYFPEKLYKFRETNQMEANKQPEYILKFHSLIWQNYGEKLFPLFDLRRPELWAEYSTFIKKYYDISGLLKNVSPPIHKIC